MSRILAVSLLLVWAMAVGCATDRASSSPNADRHRVEPGLASADRELCQRFKQAHADGDVTEPLMHQVGVILDALQQERHLRLSRPEVEELLGKPDCVSSRPNEPLSLIYHDSRTRQKILLLQVMIKDGYLFGVGFGTGMRQK